MLHNRSKPLLCLPVCIAAVSLLALAVPSAEGATARPTVTQRPEHGLTVVEFALARGTVTVRVPDDLTQGDQITVTLAASHPGLAGHELELAGATARVGDGRLVASIPFGEALKVGLELRSPAGARVARAALPVAVEVPEDLATVFDVVPDHLFLPRLAQAGRPIRLMGAFGGSFEGLSATLAGRPLELLAVSPRALVAATPGDLVGTNVLAVTRGADTVTGELRTFSIRLQADKTALRRGESARVRVEVAGLLGLNDPFTLNAINRTPEVVTLDGAGGGVRSLTVTPEAVRADGTYATDLNLSAVGTGAFAVAVEAVAIGETTHLPNVTTPPHLAGNTAYAPHNSHQTGTSWPAHQQTVTWPPHTPNVSYPGHVANVTWAPHTAERTFPPSHRINVTWWVHDGVTTWVAPVATCTPTDGAAEADEEPCVETDTAAEP